MLNSIEDIPAYCITLDRRPDRWQKFMSQTAAAGLPVKRWSGIDGALLDVSTDERVSVFTRRNILEKTRRSHEEIDSIGAIGCALSHIGLWKELVASKHEYFLIFEDDAIVPPDFVESANKLLTTSPRLSSGSCDVWMLGGAWKAEDNDIARYKRGGEPAIILGKFYLIHAYIISRRAATIFLNDGIFPINAHIDHYMSMCARFNNLRVAGSPQLRLRQSGQISDIQLQAKCNICDVPTDVHDYFMIDKKNTAVIAVSYTHLTLPTTPYV